MMKMILYTSNNLLQQNDIHRPAVLEIEVSPADISAGGINIVRFSIRGAGSAHLHL